MRNPKQIQIRNEGEEKMIVLAKKHSQSLYIGLKIMEGAKRNLKNIK